MSGNSEYFSYSGLSLEELEKYDLGLQLRIGLQVSFIKPESGGHIIRASELTCSEKR